MYNLAQYIVYVQEGGDHARRASYTELDSERSHYEIINICIVCQY